MEVKLTCAVCGEIGYNQVSSYSEFAISGYDSSIEWSDEELEIPAIKDGKYWSRSDLIPQIGQKRVILVNSSFCETDKQEFWAFYQPALSRINGIDDHIEEIDRYAFVKCKIVNILSIDKHQAWLQVIINESILLKDSIDTIPASYEKSSFLAKLHNFSPYRYQFYRQWEYYSGNAESDLGNWFLIYKAKDNVHLVSFGEWNFHQDSAYLGNLILSPETYQSLVKGRKLTDGLTN